MQAQKMTLKSTTAILAAFMMVFIMTGLQGCAPGGNEETEVMGIVVQTADVTTGFLERTIKLSGDVIAGQSVRLFGQIPDRLTSVLVDVGDRVRQGQVLARIRDESVQAGVNQMEANLRAIQATLANLRVEYARTQRLHEAGAVANQTLEGIRTQLEATEAQEEQLQAGLTGALASSQNAIITAPFDGVIGERNLEAGDLAGPGFPVFRIVNMSTVRVVAEVSQERLGQIELGLPARVRVSSWPGEVFEGDVIRIAPVLDPLTRMTRIEVGLDNEDGRLKAGMFAEVELVVTTVDDAVVVPIDALIDEFRYVTNAPLISAGNQAGVSDLSKAQVFVADGNTAVLRDVRVGVIGEEQAQITEGISVGELVITVGKYQISNGVPIRIRNGDGGMEEGGDR
ncbi:efflux RND transporter periplasmic adaptor subunit [Candidatus Zixiibacteriota bacterium]